ncbi:MAG TPA: 50S ribosomal protein L24 [Candidatus Absconditabacterales bacterium]|nr:50S ribosomal protein L24 [Candidatus Absconditabacterales bacterium]HMT27143.1 50S ribosomal protein L24 [Candidatus Absconditabacterales bacterium]
MTKIKKGDKVKVISGKFKGTISTIDQILGDKAFVKDVNVAKKAVKGSGFVEKKLPIHVSNVMYYSDEKKATTRLGIKKDKKGKSVRVMKKFNAEIK